MKNSKGNENNKNKKKRKRKNTENEEEIENEIPLKRRRITRSSKNLNNIDDLQLKNSNEYCNPTNSSSESLIKTDRQHHSLFKDNMMNFIKNNFNRNNNNTNNNNNNNNNNNTQNNTQNNTTFSNDEKTLEINFPMEQKNFFQWTPLKPKIYPSSRYEHAMGAVGKYIWLFGGFRSSRLQDLWRYDTELNEWQQIFLDHVPPPRYGTAFVNLDPSGASHRSTQLLLFGGSSLNDTWVLHTNSPEWENWNTQGSIPTGREFPVIVLDEDRQRVLVHGGSESFSTQHSGHDDVYALDINTKEWSILDVQGPKPPHRFKHVGCVINGYFYIFSGSSNENDSELWRLDLDELQWEAIKPNSRIPRPRKSATSATINNKWIIYGGIVSWSQNDNRLDRDSVCVMDANQEEWSEYKQTLPDGLQSNPWGSASARVDKYLYMFGGYSHGTSMFYMRLPARESDFLRDLQDMFEKSKLRDEEDDRGGYY